MWLVKMIPMYQDHLHELAAERKMKLDHFAAITDQYEQEHGSVDVSSIERRIGD